MIDEQRKSPRIEIEQMAYIKPEKNIKIYAKAKDISKFGLSFISQDPVEPNKTLEISITLQTAENKKKEILIKGKVIYCCEIEGIYNSGLEFSFISESHKKILDKFIESQTY